MDDTCCVAGEEKGPLGISSYLCLFTWESLFGGVCIDMQYNAHEQYFMKNI